MIHIFRVNNYTTYLLAKLIIKNKRISESNYRFFCDRNLEVFATDKTAAIKNPYTESHIHFKVEKNIFRTWRKLAEFDQFVDRIVGNSQYAFYGYNLSKPENQLFITHPRCRSINILEEGMSCYRDKEQLLRHLKPNLSSYIKFLKLIAYQGRLKNYGAIIKNPSNFFSISAEAFPGFNSINVGGLRSLPEILADVTFEIPAGSSIYVFDSVSSIGYMKLEKHLALINQIAMEEYTSTQRCYFKFHPSQNQIEREQILKMLKELPVKYLRIPDETPLEKFVFDNKNYRFFGNTSSVLFYAALQGKETVSYHNLFEYEIPVPTMPEVYFRYVPLQNRLNGSLE